MRMLSSEIRAVPVARIAVIQVASVMGLGLLVANCSQAPQTGRLSSQEGREAVSRSRAHPILQESRPTEQPPHRSERLRCPSPEIKGVAVPDDLPLSELEAGVDLVVNPPASG